MDETRQGATTRLNWAGTCALELRQWYGSTTGVGTKMQVKIQDYY